MSRRWRRFVVCCSMAALVWVLGARVLGPSDLWDQAQPFTVSYTVDMLANGRWILPRDRGQDPATKPPLFNWLAAPAVWGLGTASEIGHKLPSVVALGLSWLVVVRLGRRAFADDGGAGELVGWLAGLLFVGNYIIFKLGYLARPDMLLTIWLLLAWLAATRLLVGARLARSSGGKAMRASTGRWLALGFWLCVGLAGLTKGPAASTIVVYALIGARVIGGSWRTAGVFRWAWGLPLCLGIVAWWVIGVWRIDPDHLRDKLWSTEVWGRLTGHGQEGSREGLGGLMTTALYMPWYYIARFAPGSVFSIIGMVALLRRDRTTGRRVIDDLGAPGMWLLGAALIVWVVLGCYSLSSSKRADYLALAVPAGALIGGWWFVWSGAVRQRGVRWLIPIALAGALGLLTIYNQREPKAFERGFGDAITGFSQRAARVIDADPHPVVFCWTKTTHVQAMLGHSERDHVELVLRAIDRGEPFWAVAGRKTSEPHELDELLARRRPGASVSIIERSAMFGEGSRMWGWPRRMTLYFVEPAARSGEGG